MPKKFIKTMTSQYGRQFDIYSNTVEVVNHDKQLQTSVHGSGGGGSTFQGYGNTSNVKISSITTPNDYLSVKQDDGTETSVHVIYFDVICNVGHKLTLVSATEKSTGEEQYIAIYNHNTSQKFFNHFSVQKLFSISFDSLQGKFFWTMSGMPSIFKFLVKTITGKSFDQPGLNESKQFMSSFNIQQYL